MRSEEQRNDALHWDTRLTRALEEAPMVEMPEGFTARVMAALPARRETLHVTRTHYGRRAMQICTLVLCLLLAASALGTHGASPAWQVAQWIFFAQLGCLLMGFTLRQWRS